MRDSKIVQLLKTFTTSEWTSCGKYLNWQFKKNAIELSLFYYLKNCRKNWETNKLDKAEVKKRIAKDLTDKDFLSRRSKLKLKLESFLLLETQKDKERKFEQQLLLGELYKKRGLYSSYKDLHNEIEKEKEKLKIYDLNTDLKIMQWYHQKYFSETVSKDRKIKFLKEAYHYLDRFYQSSKLFYETEAENLHLIFNQIILFEEKVDVNSLRVLLMELEKLVSDGRISSFEFLKKDLVENTKAYSSELQQVILLRLINACNAFIKQKRFSYKEDMIDLFDFGLTSRISLNNGRLSESRFFNMVEAKSKSDNAPESPDFIEEWLTITETDQIETLRIVAFAIWYFAQDNYEAALNIMNEKMVLKDMNIKLRVRITRICCLSSLKIPHQNFSIELNSTRAFFRERHKNGDIGNNSFEAIKNLITIIEMLWKGNTYSEIRKFKDDKRLISNEFWIEKRLKKMAQEK